MLLKKILKSSFFIVIALAIASAGYWYYQHNQYFPSTDDAYVESNVIHIAPRINGMVNGVYITNHQRVKRGQLLFTIDPRPFQIALKQAIANLNNTRQQVLAEKSAVTDAKSILAEKIAEQINAQKDYQRIMSLEKDHYVSAARGDRVTSQLKVANAAVEAAKSQLAEAKEKLGNPGDANAQIDAAKAEVAKAKLNLSYTRITSPADGYIVKFSLRNGQTVNAYQSNFALVEDHHWWVSANFKETDVARIHKGQPVKIVLDMYPHHPFLGTVESISAGSGASFSLLPPENATGNWVKVTQRFPVRIKINHPNPLFPLRLGASCTAIINTKTHQQM